MEDLLPAVNQGRRDTSWQIHTSLCRNRQFGRVDHRTGLFATKVLYLIVNQLLALQHTILSHFCGISVMAAHHLPKVRVRVRIPHTAPYATVAQMARVPAFQAGGCGIVPRLWLQRFSCRHVNFPFNPTPCLCMDHGVHMRH